MKRNAAMAVLAALALAACSGAAAPTPQIVYVTPQPAPVAAASPSAATTASIQPSPPSIRDAALTRFTVIDDAYSKAFDAHFTKIGAPKLWASYGEAQNFYRAEAQVLRRYQSNLRNTAFPADVMPDVGVLLLRISELVVLAEDFAGRYDEPNWTKVNDKLLDARAAVDAARQVVGEDLGRNYDETTEASTPSPVAASTEAPAPTETPAVTAAPTPTPTPAAPAGFPAGYVSARDAAGYVGQVATVCGTVVTANYAQSSGGAPTFLNLDEPYPNPVFTILIWDEHRGSFGGPPEDVFAGARVCIQGLVETYGGVPQIVSGGGDIEVYR